MVGTRFNALNPNGCIDFYLPAEGRFLRARDGLRRRSALTSLSLSIRLQPVPRSPLFARQLLGSSHLRTFSSSRALTDSVAFVIVQTDPRFSTFVLTQLFASTADLERTGRDQIGESHEEE